MTKNGTDPLLSAEENCAHLVEPPNELELNRAFTRKMNHLLCVMRAIQRFKSHLANIRSKTRELAGGPAAAPGDAGLWATSDPAEEAARAEEIETLLRRRRSLLEHADTSGTSQAGSTSDQEPLFLGIGTGGRDDFAMEEATPNAVSDSPTAVDYDIYGRAYEEAVDRQMKAAGGSSRPTLYLTKFVQDTRGAATSWPGAQVQAQPLARP